MNAQESKKKHFANIAEDTLDVFSQISSEAERELSEPNRLSADALARNTFTDQNLVRTTARHNEDRLRNFQALADEPAIARIVTRDDKDVIETYFITRSITPNTPLAGCRVTSRLAPVGRIASLPVGETFDLDIPNGVRSLEVLERALLRPSRSGSDWDSRDTVLDGADYGTVTIASLRALLERALESGEFDELEAVLAQQRHKGNVIEGIRRNVIQKIGLRDQPILDKFQDAIFRLPLNKQLLLLGPPGTGKTTTLIRRLGQKLSSYLDEREQQLVQSSGPDVIHAHSWLMFTPTDLLKQYVKEAFAREGVPASDQRIVTWTDYRRELARSRFGILRTGTGSGSMVMKESIIIANDDALARQADWFDDFFSWQASDFWIVAKTAAQNMASESNAEVSALGRRLVTVIDARNAQAEAGAFIAINELADRIRSIVDDMKKETDGTIRKALNIAFKANPKFLDELGRFMRGLTDVSDDVEEQDLEEEEDARLPSVGPTAAAAAYTRVVRALSRAEANKRTVTRTSRSGRIAEWLRERVPSKDERLAIGKSLQVQDSCRHFLNPVKRYVDGITLRYRRFRKIRQTEGRWYHPDGYAVSDITPLEVDLVLLAILRTGNNLLSERAIASDIENPRYSALLPVRDLHKNQIMVDEAADFSPVQLACMSALANPRIRSFFACGDFNQRITSWGARSEADFKWSMPDIDIKTIETTYRHTKQLNELAKALVDCSSGAETRAVLPERVDSDAVQPVLGLGLASLSDKVSWLANRIAEIERLTDALPSIAVLVNAESEVQGIAEHLNIALESHNIRAVACPNGQVIGQDNDVRIFDVQHIKGLEFEAVFFVGVDELAATNPPLFDKYLYVGTTRAATYLGLTCSGAHLPQTIASLEPNFTTTWEFSFLRPSAG